MPSPIASPTQSEFLAPARIARPWLRLAAFMGLSVILLIVAGVAMGAGLALADPDLLRLLSLEQGVPDGPDRLRGESVFLAIVGGSLAVLALAVLAAACLAYGRRPSSFLWPSRRMDLGLLLQGFVVMAGIGGLLMLGWSLIDGEGLAFPVFDPAYALDTRLLYLAASAGVLLIAAAAEEVVFRGVLLQVTGGFTRRIWLLCAINGLLFSAVHLDPDPIAFVARALLGLVWVWAALRLGGLEFGIGAHWANNLVIALFAAPFSEAAMPGQDTPLIALIPEAVATLLTLAAIEWIARRRPQDPAV